MTTGDDDEAEGRPVIDGQGRLFGLLNVVDVLVVLLVVAVLIGAISVVMTLGQETPEDTDDFEHDTRYVTLDFGQQPEYVAALVQPGDNTTIGERGMLEITDLYRAGHHNGTGTVIARASVNGTYNESAGLFTVDDKPLQLGNKLSLETDAVSVSGSVTAIDETGDSLAIRQQRVTVVAEVSSGLATAIGTGDEARFADEPIATVAGVESEAIEATNRKQIQADLDLSVVEHRDRTTFIRQPIRLGTTLEFYTDRYLFTGEIVAIEE